MNKYINFGLNTLQLQPNSFVASLGVFLSSKFVTQKRLNEIFENVI